MLTYEDVTGYFLKAADSIGLMTHPEHWINSRSLEREFACACHTGICEDLEQRSTCTVTFTWGPLDTVLSLEGPVGICDFFHEPEHGCSHLHTRAVPPLVIDLAYTLPLNGTVISEETLLSLTQMLKLRASEHSRRTTETRPGIGMMLHENRLRPDLLTLQQRVELPIWHPEGMRGLHDLHDDSSLLDHRQREYSRQRIDEDEDSIEVMPDNPHPEEWLPQVLIEVCQDIMQVLDALEATISYNTSSNS